MTDKIRSILNYTRLEHEDDLTLLEILSDSNSIESDYKIALQFILYVILFRLSPVAFFIMISIQLFAIMITRKDRWKLEEAVKKELEYRGY